MTTETLADALPKEIERCQELITIYQSIGPAGSFGAAMMKASIQHAQQAMMAGDLVEMLISYRDLSGYKA